MSEQENINLNKSRFGKLRNAIKNNEDIQEMTSYAWDQVLKPLFKLAFKASATNTVNAIFGTNISANSIGNVVNTVTKTTESKVDTNKTDYNGASKKKGPIKVNEWYEIEFDNEKDADDALRTIEEDFNEHERLTVAEYASACGRESEYTAGSWGWRDITSAKVVQMIKADGSVKWKVNMPSRPKAL